MEPSKKFKSLLDIQAAFPDDKSCIEYLMQIRYDGNPKCPNCEHDEFNFIRTRRKYQCKKCRKQFSPLKNTIFEQTNIPLIKWIMAIYLFTSFKKGVSSMQLAKEIDVTQKTAWFMVHKVREVILSKEPEKLSGEIEIDEVYLGGRSKNKHKSKKLDNTQGKALKNKVPVVGLYERSSNKVICKSVKNTRGPELLKFIKQHIPFGTTIYTDDNTCYDLMESYYNRKYTIHSAGEYVDGRCHTNGVERVWSLIRRGFIGTYHHMSYKHMDRYMAEFAFRIEHKDLSANERFNLAIERVNSVVKQKDITAFDKYKHNYSGRGPGFPIELLKATRKRGRLSKKREEELKASGEYSYNYKRKNKETFESNYEDYIVTVEDITSTPFYKKQQVVKVDGRNRRGRPKGSKNKPKTDIETKSLQKEKFEINLEEVKKVLSQVNTEDLQKLMAEEISRRGNVR